MLRTAFIFLLVFAAGISAQDRVRPNVEPRSLEARVHELINAERVRLKLRPLKIDEKLSNVARRHSEDMARRGFFEHVNPDGKGPTDRGRALGYTCRKYIGDYIHEGLAENIFQNNLYNRVTIVGKEMTFDWNSLEKIAVTSVNGWMNSPGHRRNILDPLYNKTGIGVTISANDQVMITQNFC